MSILPENYQDEAIPNELLFQDSSRQTSRDIPLIFGYRFKFNNK
jgi:hypothetical protein